MIRTLFPIAALLCFTTPAYAYDFFNPAPDDALHAMASDRPTTTISARTVDAGHFQVELSPISLTLDSVADTRTQRMSYASTHIRLGLLEPLELSINVEPIIMDTLEQGDESTTSIDYGNTSLRAKVNLFGNDGGGFAMGFAFFVNHITADDAVEGGVTIPVAATLPLGFELRLNAEGSLRHRSNAEPRDRVVRVSGMLRRDLFTQLALVGEIDRSIYLDDATRSSLMVGTAIAAQIDPSIQLDLGVRGGVLGPVPDLQLYCGLAGRT